MDRDFMEHMLKHMMGACDDRDYSKWVQVAKLNPEETTKQRDLARKGHMLAREVETLQKRAAGLTMAFEAERSAFWDGLYATHSLPPGSYHIENDGRILMNPKEGRAAKDKANG